jgi:ABC-2 type transport system permease protein
MFIVLGGLIVPSISATYTVVAEREKRSLDLLMALPVSVTDILLAKLLAMLVLAAVVVLPLFAIDMAVLVALGLTSAVDILLLLVLLLAAMGCSVGVALLLALLARDFRTANNLNGAFLGPLIVAMLAIIFLLTAPVRYLLLIVLLVGVGLLAVLAGLRWLTFERYLA